MDEGQGKERPVGSGLRMSHTLLMVTVIGLLGCLAIYSATFHAANPWFYVVRQAGWLAIGMVTLMGFASIPREIYNTATLPVAGVMLALLYGVLLFGGPPHHGMRGWYEFNIPMLGSFFKDIHLQPSELAKPFYVLFAAWAVNRPVPGARVIGWLYYLQCLGLMLVWWIPIAWQPDFGTLLVYVGTFVVIYWLRSGNWQHLGALALAAVPVGLLVVYVHPYVWRRFQGFIDPVANADGSAYHTRLNEASLASGGWLGHDFDAQSLARRYVPQSHSDSMFATLGENLGFLVVLALVIGLVWWLIRLVMQARRQANMHDAVVVAGIAATIGVQAMIHISVSVGLFPPTGITLPLISYGGSSVVATCAALGMVIAFSKGGGAASAHHPG